MSRMSEPNRGLVLPGGAMPVRESKSGLRSPRESAVSMMPAVSEPKSGLASSREAASPPLCSRNHFFGTSGLPWVFQKSTHCILIAERSEPGQPSVRIRKILLKTQSKCEAQLPLCWHPKMLQWSEVQVHMILDWGQLKA